MNKRLIASLLAVCVATGSGLQVPVKLLGSTIDTYGHMSLAQERQILDSNGILSSQFTAVNQPQYEEYEEIFKVKGITQYKNNGRQYGQSVLDRAFDGDVKTHWETGIANSNQFKNEVIITFDEIEEINRIVYAPRPGNKGHVKQMSIYASLTEEGEDFELVASGQTDIRSSLSEFKFKNTEFKRLKFVFDEANQGWAAAGEFMFFKEDQVADKMDRLFTDATMSKVSEEFNTIESIKALELEAQSHPFYESYKENLLNAIAIVEQEDVIETDAIITPFTLFNSPYIAAYDATFRVGSDRIVSITNNGGQYAQSALKYAIDEDINTHWETGKPNSATFKNEIIITLDQAEVLDRVVYKSRQGGKGFAKNFTIYASSTIKGDNFSKITTGEHAVTNDLLEIQFNPTNIRRLKFVFDNAQDNWASIGDFRLYKEDPVSKVMKELFTNGLMMEVNPKYTSAEAIAKLEEQVKSHPLKESFLEDIKLAKEIVSGKDLFENIRVVTGEQRGRYREETAKRSINGAAYSSFESFGKYVTPGEEIIVYVDADARGVLPQLAFGQVGKSKGNWRKLTNLVPGKNVIKAPTDMNSAALYLVNEAYPGDQAYAPRARVEGGTKFPTYFHGETDPQAFFEELQAYAEHVEYDDAAFLNGNPKGKVFNITEFVSENVVITTSAKGALAGLTEAAKQGYDVSDTMEDWEQLRDMFQTFLEFEENATEEKHSYFPNKFISRVFEGVPHAYADHGYTGYLGSSNPERDGGFYKLIVMPPRMPGSDDWAYGHEFGHIFNTKYMVHGEVTNNLFAQEYRRIKGISGDRANWNGIMKRFQGEEVKLGFFENLAILSQLNIAYGYDTYAKASRAVRDNTALISSIQGGELRRLAVAYSLGGGENLLDFFKGWNYTDVTPQMEEAVKHLPKPTRKIEYLHGGAYDYAGDGFSEDVEIDVSSGIDAEAKTNILKFTIDDDNQSDLLGYEILKDGEVIGFTKDSTFTIKDANIAQNENYQVVAYAKDLTTAQPVSVNTFAPSIKVQQDKITLALNEEFNPIDYIKGLTSQGDDITLEVKVTHNVDTKNKGIYELKYTLLDQGITVEKVVPVEVVSGYDYLSDIKWSSVETAYGTPRTNTNIKGRVNGDIKVFEKGMGIHAKGKMVYDLSGKEYDRFEALLGVDGGIAAQGNSSIAFKVIGDGEVLASTKILKHADDMTYINVPITGVSELVIEVSDGANGNASDHSIIANPKLTTNNAIPTITVADKQVQLGEAIDLMEGVEAIDAEDGDLTAQVEVSGIVDFDQPGYYPIIYKVTDSDGNETIKTRNIAVVDMNDFTYVSDYNWTSASAGAGSIQKDKSPSGNVIRLTDENGKEVQFEKGLGAHARSVIKYDLTDIEADYFSAYVGVDRGMYNSVGAVAFEVWLDGEKVAETDVIRARDAMEYLEVNLAGAKELMLVATDGGNGNGSDHSVWADAKFHYANENNIKVNTKELTQLVEEVAQLNSEDYTESSWNLLVEVKEEALNLLEGSSTQEQVDEMVEKLKAAKENLVKVVNDTTLKALVEKVNELEIYLYTAKSSQVLQAKLKEANEVLGLENATQEVIDEAQKALEVAMNNLELSKGKAELHKLLEIANKMEESNYTEEADWAHFAEWTAYYNKLYLDVTIHDEEMYETVIAGYTAMIAEVESHKIDKPEVSEPEVTE